MCIRDRHNQGHHVDVATPRDSATARFGEGYWAFFVRDYRGTWRRAWRLETKRAHIKGYSPFSLRHEGVASVIMQIILWGVVIIVLGLHVLPYLLICALVSSLALSSQNYVTHYAMLRDKRPNGKYAPCEPKHSWNCSSLVTNLTSYNLALHSDHHVHPTRHYQHLRPFESAPQLPYGYMTMFTIAYFPPLFRKVMDPLVLERVNGDMDKVLTCLLYTSPSPRDQRGSRMPSSA